MIGALWTGISGLSAQQIALDNEANNIANVNTIGYKSSRISFADQMYQDRIGKGSRILDSEKIYTQGNLKVTGVNYDLALSGEGFFTLAESNPSGSPQIFYSRSGNFRMGNDGTLQDPVGNRVQGWKMSNIDQDDDVITTNHNVHYFNNDYTKLVNSKIIKHSTFIESISAKTTDYTQTSKSDVQDIFTGSDFKNKSTKITDVEKLITNYKNAVYSLNQNPDGLSSASKAQTSYIDFDDESTNSISKEGDELYIYLDSIKYSQTWDTDYATTIKLLADKISEIPGFKASMTNNQNKYTSTTTPVGDVEAWKESTSSSVVAKGIMKIESLVPGQAFTVSELGSVSGLTTVQGSEVLSQLILSISGTGQGAVDSAKEALAKVVSGVQRDVYTSQDLKFTETSIFLYQATLYDKNLQTNIQVPSNPIFINSTGSNGEATADDFVYNFNLGLDKNGTTLSPKITDYLEAVNINGNLVIRTLDENYDMEFTGNLQQLPTIGIDLKEIVDNSEYTFDIVVNGTSHSIEVDYLLTDDMESNPLFPDNIYQDIRDQIKTQLDGLNAANTTYELGITENIDGIFSIYTANQQISFSGSNVLITDTLPTTSALNIATISSSTTYEKDKITITEPIIDNHTYSFEIMGITITYTTGVGESASDIINDFKAQILAHPTLNTLVEPSTPSNVIGNPNDGVVLVNGHLPSNLVSYTSDTSGKFMIEIPSGTLDLSLYLDEYTQDDTFQVFTKSGKHIAGTASSDSSWMSPNTPANIVNGNLGTYFDLTAVYSDELSAPSIANTYYGPYNSLDGNSNNPTSSNIAAYIDKDGNPQNKTIEENEEFVVIPNVTDDLVIFVNGVGAYRVSAEWGSNNSSSNNSLLLTQTGLINPAVPSGLSLANLTTEVTSEDVIDFNLQAHYEHRFTIDTDDTKSSSVYTLTIEGKALEIKTDHTPTMNELLTAFNTELAKDSDQNEKYEITLDGNDIVISEKLSDFGYAGFSQNSTLTIKSLSVSNDTYETAELTTSEISGLEKNNTFSGREGAGAEFLEIVTRVNQTESQDSIQLKLNTLGISDSAFGEFSVDETGLITMKQDGLTIAVGQASIAMFNNNRGLKAVGNNLLEKTNNSGAAIYNLNNNRAARIEEGTLELSEANLSESLVNLMVFQRAFEANARSITSADELLNTLINLKR